MDKQRVEDVVTDKAAEVAGAIQGKLDQGKGVLQIFRQAPERRWKRPLPWYARFLRLVVRQLRRPGILSRGSLARWAARPVNRRQPSISRALAPEGI
jgi:hypothetical protein